MMFVRLVSISLALVVASACLRFSATARPDHAPVAKVAAASISLKAGGVATLDGSQSSDADGDKLTFRWALISDDLGIPASDSFSTAAKFDFVAPAKSGHAVFLLVVNDGIEDSAPAAVDVDVTAAPSAAISGPTSGPTGSPAQFVASTDDASANVSFQWSIIGGPACTANPSPCITASGASMTFTPPVDGGYQISLVVVDGDVHGNPAVAELTASDGAVAIVIAPLPASIHAGDQVTLDASASADANHDPLSFQWTLLGAPPNGGGLLGEPNAAVTTLGVGAHGDFHLTLTVTEGASITSADLHVVVDDSAPVVTLASTALATSSSAPAIFTASASDADLADTVLFSWTVIGVPAGAATPTLANADTANVSVTATTKTPVQDATACATTPSGCYQLRVTASDGTLSSTADAFLVVTDSAPSVSVTTPSPVTTTTGVSTLLAATATDQDAGDVASLSFTWRVTSAPAGGASCVVADAAGPCLAAANTPTPVFTAPLGGEGTYTLTVVAGDGTATSAIANVVVVANAPTPQPGDNPPSVSATSPVTTTAGVSIPLSASASDPDAFDVLSFTWRVTEAPASPSPGAACVDDVAGGPCLAAADTATPIFTPPLGGDGTYVVRVTVSDGRGASAVADVVVTAAAPPPPPPPPNLAPTAVALIDVGTGASATTTTSTTIVSGDTVQLDGSQSSDADGDTIASFAWSVVSAPAGSVALFSPASADVAKPAVTLRGRGAYVLGLVVTDDAGLSSTISLVHVGADNAPPVVNAGGDASVPNQTPLSLAGSASDADGDTVAFRWTVVDAPGGDLASGTLTNATSANATFTPNRKTTVTDPALCGAAECYVLQLDGFDGIAHATDTIVVTSTNRAPIADAGLDQGNAQELVALDGTASFDPDGDALTSFTWTQTAGPDVTGGTGTLTGAVPSFTAPSATTYAFSLVVSDGIAASAPDSVVVVVQHVDRAPVVTVPNAQVVAIAGAKFPLHADVFDADADPTNVAWTLVAGDRTRFATSLAGTDPSLTAPALKALLAANNGDNSAQYSVTATDPAGKTSAPVVVTVFVLPGAEHIVVSPNGTDTGTCGSVAAPCATFSFASSAASVQARDLVAVSGTYHETAPSSGILWPGAVSLVGGRDATTFARSTPSTLACTGTAETDTACLLFTAADDAKVHIDNLAVVADPGATNSTVAVRCDQCAASFTDSAFSASGAPGSTALLVDAGDASQPANPTFAKLSLTVDDACDLEPLAVLADSTVTASDVTITATADRAACASTTFALVEARAGLVDLTRASAHATSTVSASGEGVLVDVQGTAHLTDSKVVVDLGDGVVVKDGSALLDHDVIASSAAAGTALVFDAKPQNPSLVATNTAVTGFASGANLADNGAGASFTTSSVTLPATCDGATATTTADLDPAGAFATTCKANGLVAALARVCQFSADFTIVDETCLN